jgi:uncharacterized protein (UPF0179 family)
VVVVETTEAAVEATSVVVVEAEEASMVVVTEVEEAFEAAVAATEAAAAIEAAAATEEVVAFVAVTEVASAEDVEGLKVPRSLGKSRRARNLRLITNITSQRRHQHSAARC